MREISLVRYNMKAVRTAIESANPIIFSSVEFVERSPDRRRSLPMQQRRTLSGSRPRSTSPAIEIRRSLQLFPSKYEFRAPKVVKASHEVQSLTHIQPRRSPPKPEVDFLFINRRAIAKNLLLDAFPVPGC